jgi:membrane protein DedA with SNARE-associated domain
MTVLTIALGHNLHDLLRAHALPLIACIVFFEELGLPSPLPGELMMLLAGVQAAQGIYPLWLVLLVQEVAALLGGSGLYLACRRVGRPLVLRYGRYVHLRAETLARAEGLIRRRGFGAVAVGRVIPGVCIVVPVAAGVLAMPYPVFLSAFAVGVLGYVGGLTLIGYVVGPHALTLFDRATLPVGALLSLGLLVVLLVAAHRLAARLPTLPDAPPGPTGIALLAGGFAGLAGMLAANGVVDGGRWAYRLAGRDAPLAATGVGSGWRLLLGWPLFLLVACGLGIVDDRLVRRGVPYAARTALLGAVPLLLTVLVVYPAVEGHPVRWSSLRDDLLLATEAARWAGFGLALHAVLPTLVQRAVSPVTTESEGDDSQCPPRELADDGQ